MPRQSQLNSLAPLIAEAVSVEGEADLTRVLRTLVSEVMTATGAPYVALGVIGEHNLLSDFVFEGITEEEAERIGGLPTGHGVLGTVIRENKTIVLESIAEHPDSVGFPEHHPPMDAFLGVPVSVGGEAFGNLYLTDKEGGFTEEDIAVVEAMSRIAGAAVRTARLQVRLNQVAITEDRQRIARDLHDSVIQDLFAVGLGLQQLSARVTDDQVADMLDRSIDTLDESVNSLRRYVSELRRPTPQPSEGLDVRVQAVVSRLGAVYPARVELSTDPFDEHETDDEILLLVTEALSNSLRHSEAEAVEVSVMDAEGGIVIRVVDNGTGFDPSQPRKGGMGMANMRTRVLGLGGDMAIDSNPGRGTTVELRIPATARRPAG
jgi:signal transduction histidine kinase